MPSVTSAFSTFVEDNSIGNVAWNNESNAASSNDSHATTNAMALNNISYYLKCTNPSSLSIPTGATITGIRISIERKALIGGSPVSLRDYSIRLVKGGTIQGDNKADTVTDWPSADASVNRGGDGELWGLTWLYTDFGSGFGVAISCKNHTSASTFGYIDYVSVTVYFELSTIQTEGMSINEALTFLASKAAAENISLEDILTMLIQPSYEESLTLTDACEALQIIINSQSESINLGDFVEFLNGKVYSDDITLSDALVFLAGLMNTEGLTLTDAVNFLSAISSAENITLADSLAKLLQWIGNESINLSDMMSSYVFIPNVPLAKYSTRILIDMLFDSGTKRFSSEDMHITE